MANNVLKCHAIVYENHLRTLRVKENDVCGDKFFHCSFHSKIV